MHTTPTRSRLLIPPATRALMIAAMLAVLPTSPAYADPLLHEQVEPPSLSLDRAISRGIRWVDARRDDVLYPVNINNWWGHMNRQGDLVVFPQFDWTDFAWDGRMRAVHDGLTGFIDGRGNWLVEPIYPYADRYAEGYAVVSDGERFGYLDKTGRTLLPIALDGALRFREGFAAVQEGGRVGFIDRRGKLAVALRFVRARSFHEGLAVVQLPGDGPAPGALGYINKAGRLAFTDTQHHFSDLGDFHDGLARAKRGRHWGYIDRRFQWRIEPRFNAAGDFAHGVAPVQLDHKWGYIDKAGRMTVPPRYDRAYDFTHGLGLVMADDQFGYVNRVGDERIALQFDWAEPLTHELARVSQRPGFGYVDAAGHVWWNPRSPFQGIYSLKRRDNPRIIRPDRSRSPGHRLLAPPPWREPAVEAPYPPDHLYDPELPRPPHP